MNYNEDNGIILCCTGHSIKKCATSNAKDSARAIFTWFKCVSLTIREILWNVSKYYCYKIFLNQEIPHLDPNIIGYNF